MLPNGVYEIRNEEGKTTRATGSHLKMYMSSDACCMEDEDEDQSSSQGDCVSKILVCKYMYQILVSLQLMYVYKYMGVCNSQPP